jgi:hypothetical protein
MNSKHPKLYFIITIGVGLLAILFVVWFWGDTLQVQEESNIKLNNFGAAQMLEVNWSMGKSKPEKREVKGIYLTAYSAASPKVRAYAIDLINKTELNAVIIDIKDYSGYVLYDSELPLVNELGTEKHRLVNIRNIINEFHNNDIYVIARQTVFQDPVLAEVKKGWAIKSKYGGIWRDHKGLAWVDPTQREVWNYNIAIAREAMKFGFDEINFDYVRFPSDGDMSAVLYTNGEKEKHEVMHDFFQRLSDKLSSGSAWLSIDMFGFVMERHDGMWIGQRLEDATDYIDYICPMMYPSHYPSGHLGLANPADNPTIVFENGMAKGMPYFEGKRAQARPWIQAFDLGSNYRDGDKIRAQIDAVEKYTDGGWLIWDASNRYTTAGLKLVE